MNFHYQFTGDHWIICHFGGVSFTTFCKYMAGKLNLQDFPYIYIVHESLVSVSYMKPLNPWCPPRQGEHWGGSLRSPRKAPDEILQIWSPWSQECPGVAKSGDHPGFFPGESCQLVSGSWVKTSDETQQIPVKGLVWYLTVPWWFIAMIYSGGYKWSIYVNL